MINNIVRDILHSEGSGHDKAEFLCDGMSGLNNIRLDAKNRFV